MIANVEARTAAFADPQGTLRVRYPAGWLPVAGSTAALDVQDPFSGGAVPTRLIVAREPRAADRTLAQVATETALARSQQLTMYRVLSERRARVGGQDALLLEYAFVDDPHEIVLAAQRVPVVIRGIEAVIPTERTVYHVDLRAAAAVFERERVDFERILRDIQL